MESWKLGPPWTTRCPTASISLSETMQRASPLHNVASRLFSTHSDDKPFSFSFRTCPFEFLTVINAPLPLHSMCPSHIGNGGFLGRASPISYRTSLWLLEPELRTRIFTEYVLPQLAVQIACHFSVPLTLHLSSFPDLGSSQRVLVWAVARIWAEAARNRSRHRAATRRCAQGGLAHCMQTLQSYVRTQRPSVL